eukprot:XP_001696633.1 predicted protein [Chlamydomonas reinhardtii]
MLAALALKELEAQRLESGALLRGPLSAYSLRVSLADVHLDKASGPYGWDWVYGSPACWWQDGSGAPLQRFLFSLPPPIRVALLRQLPRLAAQLAAAGVDLQRAGRDAAYRGPLAPAAPAATPAGSKQQQQQRQKQGGAAASTRSGKLPRLTVDVLGMWGELRLAARKAAGHSPDTRGKRRKLEVAGRVYARGSGERLVVRLPTYPAFEGYPLSELDKAREGELGALNRLVAARTAAAQWAAFRRDLLFNLGVRGEKLRDNDLPGAPAWPANLRTELTRPVVVYGIGPDGATQYPPVYVAAGDGAKRPLNEQEKVYQERRLPGPRLPYHMGRIRTLPELN